MRTIVLGEGGEVLGSHTGRGSNPSPAAKYLQQPIQAPVTFSAIKWGPINPNQQECLEDSTH